jgi:Holliday junction resolvase-like predicted endonuclease
MIELSSNFLIAFAIVFLIGLVLGIVLLWWLKRLWLRWRIQRQHSTAKLGESEAEQLLVTAGYSIVDRQARIPLHLLFDGAPWETDIIADLIVAKDDHIFVAEVKTGRNAPDIRSASTRRQLLEYYVTYRPEGVLLVDMTAKVIHTIEFLLNN